MGSFHAPEVECIGKGKARMPYEFGVKVLIVILRLILSALMAALATQPSRNPAS